MGKKVMIPGELASATIDGIVASAGAIYDYRQGTSQEALNTRLIEIAKAAQEYAELAGQYNLDTQEAFAQLSEDQQGALLLAASVRSNAEAIEKLKEQLGGYSLKEMSESEMEALIADGQTDANTLYFVTEDEEG